MRKARYDLKKVRLPNASLLGYGVYEAKPGHWVTFTDGRGGSRMGRVLGRIAETGFENPCVGWLAVVALAADGRSAHVKWVDPASVLTCVEQPPKNLLAWITGDLWVKDKHDIAYTVAMSEHGTLSEQFIERRGDPAQAYNARPEYIKQFILE